MRVHRLLLGVSIEHGPNWFSFTVPLRVLRTCLDIVVSYSRINSVVLFAWFGRKVTITGSQRAIRVAEAMISQKVASASDR